MYVAVQVAVAAGASVVTVHAIAPTLGSSIVSDESVTLPVFVTTNVYGSEAPIASADVAPACLSSARLGEAAISVSVASVASTGAPTGGVADTVAVLAT